MQLMQSRLNNINAIDVECRILYVKCRMSSIDCRLSNVECPHTTLGEGINSRIVFKEILRENLGAHFVKPIGEAAWSYLPLKRVIYIHLNNRASPSESPGSLPRFM